MKVLKRSRYYLPFLFGLFSSYSSTAQEIVVKKTMMKGGDIILEYDLIDDNKDHKYTIELYSSLDDYIQPLKSTDGDVGIDLSVGGNKKIIWHVKEELGGDFKGEVALELKGRLYIPFVQLNDFDKIDKFKINSPRLITWAAGRGSDVLTWDLFNDKDELVHTFTNIANVGEYELVIPKGVKSGKGYHFQITDQKNKDDIVITSNFQVVRKIPLFLTAGLAAIGVGTGVVVVGSMGGGEDGSNGISRIPDPVLPSNIE